VRSISFGLLCMCICNCWKPAVKFGPHYHVALQSVLLICKCLLCGVQTHIELCVMDKWSHFQPNRFEWRYWQHILQRNLVINRYDVEWINSRWYFRKYKCIVMPTSLLFLSYAGLNYLPWIVGTTWEIYT